MHHRSQICLCHFLLPLVSMPDLATRMYHSPHDDVFYQPYFKTNTSFQVAGDNCLEYIFPCVRVSGHHCSVILECNVYTFIYSCNMAIMYSKLTYTVETWPAMCVNGIRVLKYNIFFALMVHLKSQFSISTLNMSFPSHFRISYPLKRYSFPGQPYLIYPLKLIMM